MLSNLAQDLVELKKDEVLTAVNKAVEANADPMDIIQEGQRGMGIVGEKFETGEFFLAQLMLSAQIFQDIIAIVEPLLLSDENREFMGKVVFATPQGDIHDIGKNIVSVMLKAHGYEVHDLGVDVSKEKIIEKVKEVKPDFVCFSCLLTTAFESMKNTINALEVEGLLKDLKVLIGGGVTSEQTRDYVNADFQSIEVMDTIGYCNKAMGV
ncbi:Methanogenic corrinoid protein MtbC1 [Dethiosulfatibacter aminovorans DSM 17477]|uniref:Methanogenic corrinoid protein MtbC1 n=1 Tax=Dethiosulfatibacter aminovorans DSM 17477 TaxID=1121476 RepID=A0A1M6M3K7_9FIRM|nr:cobalamin-dependent protein [Dethiosulfatibacter aminovorans]SHJ78034.1 Methanogenic corrinoid protein MtbC1 [Dethiosulfatibacter aminovorans DSM 17477]